jgi:hypothetical protein
LRESGSAGWFDNDPVRPQRVIGLDGFEYLSALRNGVAVGVHNLEIDFQFARSCVRYCGLLDLEVVVFGDWRNEKSQFFHMLAPPSCARPFAFCLSASYGDYPWAR